MSNSKPETLVDLGNGWALKSWRYDNAPIELHGPKGFRMEIENDGDVCIEVPDGTSYYGTTTQYVPAAAFRSFIGWTRAAKQEGGDE